MTFAQALSEAGEARRRTLLVVSIPASDIEVGGEAGKEALRDPEHIFGREGVVEAGVAEEGFEIVRRRLFEDVPAELQRERDAVVKRLRRPVPEARSRLPARGAGGDYRRRMEAAYPIHPELFDQLFEDWSTLEKFQRTRGVLRLMAAVIHELWERDDGVLMIMPASVPIDA